mmetsp:Transcript_27217/g.55694  ORF Transcript_27217/g.55694 Transcript_27217/m.55694 type:complete len:81 (-) Transcript_27217:117-359(-)
MPCPAVFIFKGSKKGIFSLSLNGHVASGREDGITPPIMGQRNGILGRPSKATGAKVGHPSLRQKAFQGIYKGTKRRSGSS